MTILDDARCARASMGLPANDAIPPAIWQAIQSRLDAVEVEHDVRLLLAVESGSRAWGFPSPDSDYDVRFIYVRPRDWYLGLDSRRDVIEQPIEDEIDLNGWDIRKALGLLLKSKAIVGEWMNSPIRYRPDHPFVDRLRSFADAAFEGRAIAHHYARLGGNAAERWLEGGEPAPVKRYFYALRPALAIRCLRLHPDRRPPMNLQMLIVAAELPAGIVEDITGLVEAKRRSNELSNAARIPRLDALIRSELGRASDVSVRSRDDADLLAQANQLFVDLVNHDRD